MREGRGCVERGKGVYKSCGGWCDPNPFASLDSRVTSPAFEEAVYRLIDAADETLQYRGPLPF
jgi:hypothetical protein